MKANHEYSAIELGDVEEMIAYKFGNKDLLKEAFTHASFSGNENSSSYNTLKYVGDAVLGMLVSREVYRLHPNLSSGEFTRLRSANMDTEKLARVAIRHCLHLYLRHNEPLLEEQIRTFTRDISDYPLHSNGLIDTPKILADIVVSAIGAVYVDSNCSSDIVWKVFEGLLEPIMSPDMITRNPVAELYEFCQKKNKTVKFVDLWAQNATFNVLVDDQLVGTGSYTLKKAVAHRRAAKNALENIRTLVKPDCTANMFYGF